MNFASEAKFDRKEDESEKVVDSAGVDRRHGMKLVPNDGNRRTRKATSINIRVCDRLFSDGLTSVKDDGQVFLQDQWAEAGVEAIESRATNRRVLYGAGVLIAVGALIGYLVGRKT